MKLSTNEIAYVLINSGFPPSEWATAIAVAMAESRGETDAVGTNDVTARPTPVGSWGSQDLGLWQINNYWHGAKLQKLDWRDPFSNAVLAHQVWLEAKNSWTAWSTYKDKLHEKFLPHATIGLKFPFSPPPGPQILRNVVELQGYTNRNLGQMMTPLEEIRSHFA